MIDAIFKCVNCKRQIFVSYTTSYDLYRRLLNINGSIAENKLIHIVSVLPESNPVDVPEHVPVRVAELFREAEENMGDERYESAMAGYRKALEVALKSHTPDIEAFKLDKRIDRLFSEGKITESLKDWAHEIRSIGNVGLHDLEKPEQDEVLQMALLSRYLLIYLYTLPEKVNQSRIPS